MNDIRPPEFLVDVVDSPDGVTLTAAGDLDLATVDRLVGPALALLTTSTADLTVDMAGVGFCDSAGINGLVRLRNEYDRAGRGFCVTNLQGNVHRVIVELSGLGEFLNVQTAVGQDPPDRS